MISYYNITDSVEGLYANHLDQLEGIVKPPCITRERLQEISNSLRAKHTNFVSCRLSSVRCSGFTTSHEGSIKEEPTVAIYCRVKGSVPLNEEEFESTIDGYRTDIRPGFIFACNGISSGNAIFNDERLGFGSLGPHFQIRNTTYAFSAAHTFFPSHFFLQKIRENGQQLDNFIIDINCSNKDSNQEAEPMDIDESNDEIYCPDSAVYAVQSKAIIGNIQRVILRTGKELSQNRAGGDQSGSKGATDFPTGICGMDVCVIALDAGITPQDFPEEVTEMVKNKYGK